MKIINFDKGWTFSYSSGNAYKDAHGAAYKKSVDLPHDFMISTKRTPDGASEGAGGFFAGGIGTYEKHFTLEESRKGHTFLLQIEGSYGNTEVWINGSLACLHHYGYTEFFADLTKWVKFGADNKLKIVVENNSHPNSRWYSGSGLYRHVNLLEGGTTYLHPWSVGITTPDLETVTVAVAVSNTGAGSSLPVTVTIADAGGVAVAKETVVVEVAEAKAKSESIEGMSAQPVAVVGEGFAKLSFKKTDWITWSPETPYLYTATVCAGDDEVEVPFGVRKLAFTREEGFLLNGVPTKLKGGCIHHDNGVAGAAAYEELELRRIQLLKESGYNAIRTSHNPQSVSLMNACDRLGMLVMDEAFDCWRAKKNSFDYHLYFEKHWKEDLASMILRDRNHPSVIMYSIGNEIGERDGSGNGPEISAELCAFARSLDDTRALTNGVCAVFLDAGEFGGILANIFGSGGDINFASLPPEVLEFLHQADEVTERWGEITAPFCEDLDVVGYNYLDDRYEKDGQNFPTRLIVGTESYPKAMKTVWERTMAQPYVLGDFTWTAMDYLGESGIGHALYGEEGGLFMDYPWHTGNCGDFDICGFIRPQGRFRRLIWKTDTAPVITFLHPKHLGKKEAISSWGWADVYESYTWPGYEGAKLRCDIYSDADEVELCVNGSLVAREAVPESGIVSLPVCYEPGEVCVTNYRGGEAAEKSVLKTATEAVAVRLIKEAVSSDKLYVYTCEAVDVDGNRVPCFEGEVTCDLEGYELVGFGSGSPVSEDTYTSGTCCFFEGRALLIVKPVKEHRSLKLRETRQGGICTGRGEPELSY